MSVSIESTPWSAIHLSWPLEDGSPEAASFPSMTQLKAVGLLMNFDLTLL